MLEPANHDLPIREDRGKKIFIPRLTQRAVGNFGDFEQFFLPALQNRTTASTKLNQRSSRSHSVLLLKVDKMERAAPFRQRTGKLYLIDLAGSEDNRRTGNEGVRLRESGSINSSLFVLSKVVDALNQGLPRIPYRDSKLTRLLQDSLGGTAHSLMIANIAPESRHYYNTLTALNFAAKSKLVVNHPFTLETIQPIGAQPMKRAHQGDESKPENSTKGSKKPKAEPASVSEQPDPGLSSELAGECFDSAVLERLARLEQMLLTKGREGPPLLDTPRSERQRLLNRLDESLQQIQRLEERQKELENVVSSQTGASRPKTAPPPLQNTHPPPHRKQALVSPLQRIENTDGLRTGSVLVIKRSTADASHGVDAALVELSLNPGLAQSHRDHVLHLLNHGSARQLKSLPRVGDKTAQIILAWREGRGGFEQIEDLAKAGLSEKTINTFMRANALSRVSQ